VLTALSADKEILSAILVLGYQREEVIGKTLEQLFEDGAGGTMLSQV
jgi:hypothetical protein